MAQIGHTLTFDSRLVQDIRSGDNASGTLSKVWDFDMRDREAEFKDDLREASGVGKKRGRKVRMTDHALSIVLALISQC